MMGTDVEVGHFGEGDVDEAVKEGGVVHQDVDFLMGELLDLGQDLHPPLLATEVRDLVGGRRIPQDYLQVPLALASDGILRNHRGCMMILMK